MTHINSELIFPTPYWWVDLTDLDNDKMLKTCYELERNQQGRNKSNRGGYQSDDLPHDHPSFTDLLDCICSASQTIFEEAYVRFCDTPLQNVCIGNYWVNINRKNDYNVEHVHPGCFLSGVYYVSADSQLNQGSIIFRRESISVMHHGSYFDGFKENKYPPHLEQMIPLPPRTGGLVLFPSYLSHCVDPNQSDTDRVSISFNIGLK
tara:strand:- start:59 stop:676 length:618 start_codon:yes stop_codon:yes gene_type:complete